VCALWAAATAAAAQTHAESGRVLVVCDFESHFDDGSMGRFVASNIRAKISRYRLFIITEDMDREPVEKQAGFKPKFDMKIEAALGFAKEWLDADMLMWGKVEKGEGDTLRVSARVADQKVGSDRLRLDTVAVAPNRYSVQEASYEILNKLTGLTLSKYPPLPPDAEERWEKGPNLVGQSRGFELGKAHPLGWERFGVDWQMGEAHWEKHPDEQGKCIVFRMSPGVAAVEGVAYYSEFFDISPGATYRVQVKLKSMAPTCKVFVKYYAWLHTPTEPKGQWREVGRSPLNPKGPKGQWGVYQRDCHPRVYRTRRQRVYKPEKCRIGLYAYHPGGVVYWDDVVFKRISDPPKDADSPYDVIQAGRKPGDVE
jgi:hypothetical protein